MHLVISKDDVLVSLIYIFNIRAEGGSQSP
jgi:hypothetical protein